MDTQSNTVYIFPDTLAKDEVVFPLVQVFDRIVHLSPVENDPSVSNELSGLQEQMVEQGELAFSCPAPLAEDRDRFLLLVRDLWQRPGEYAGQLSNLSLAGLGSSSPESKNSIISTLLRQTGIQGKGRDTSPENAEQEQQRQMILWQARLLLKLGEIFDREQEALQQSLHKISAKENGLLAELRREDDQPASADQNPAQSGTTYSQLRLRLKAWSRLFALGEQPAASPCYITSSRDAIDLLLEQYSLNQDQELEPFFQLTLPVADNNEDPGKALEILKAFKEDAAELLARFAEIVANPAAMNGTDPANFNGTESQWEKMLESHFPADRYKRCSLTFYSLPDREAGSLFLETFGRDEDELPRLVPGSKGLVTALLAVEGAAGAVIS